MVWFENRFDEREPGWGPVEIIEDGVTATVQTETQTLAVDVDGDGDTDLLESSSVYGLRYFENVRHLGTDPLSNDSDGDGLLDGDEVKNHLTNPLRIDSDDDGLGDAIEVGIAGTDPNDPDHDDDGLLDGEEGATGGGPFATPRSMLAYESGAQFDLDLGDLDGDGKLDVVATAYGTAGIFENRLRTPEGDFRSWLHDPDVFSVAYGDGALLQGALGVPLAYVEGDGVSYRLFADVGSSPPFGNAVSTGGGSGAHHTRVRAVDFDGDGDEDALYGPFLAGGIQWNENRLEEPSADLGPVETLVIVSGLGSVTDWHPADLDGDDDLDLLVVEQTTNSVWWFENRRDEPSADFASAALVMAGGEHSGRVTAGDVDGDGDLDPIATTFRYGDLTWFENRLSTGQPFVEHVAGVSSDYVTRLLSEDMNGDGYADIVVGSATSGFDYGPQQIRVYESAGSPAPMAVQLIETGANNGGGDVVAVDIDDDGDVDLLASNGDELILIERLTNLETDPHDRDSDDDGFEDGLEVEHGSDPNDASSVPALQALPLGSFAALFVQVGLLCGIGVARLRVRATG